MGCCGQRQDRPGEVAILIDRRELAKAAREQRLSLVMIEKDYVLGWILFGISTSLSYLILKGGTALSKVYFPKVWRLSEDLDFTLPKEVGDYDEIARIVTEMIFPEVERQSKGLKFSLKSKHQNPGYLQLKIQYLAVLETKNWLRIYVRKEELTEPPIRKSLPKTFSDYPDFELNIKSLEATLADKLLAMMERTKARDYYDIWKLLKVPELDLPR